MVDLIIRNGSVIDGTGNPRYRADIAIKNGRIVKLAPLVEEASSATVDASNLVVAPGFFDVHTHSDACHVSHPHDDVKLRQGVTIETIGHCGYSLAPVSPEQLEPLRRYLSIITGDYLLEWSWRGFGDLAAIMGRAPRRIHVAGYIGHGTVRIAAMGVVNRAPTTAELQRMEELVDEAMVNGALGLTYGLFYPPGSYAKLDELVALAKVVGKHGGICAIHMRSEGYGLIQSTKEAIAIAERAEVPMLLSHHKAAGKPNWGKVKESLELVEEARARGVRLALDVYPYTAANTVLRALMPPWAYEGGTEALMKRLRDPIERARLELAIEGPGEWENMAQLAGWEGIIISSAPNQPELEGQTVAEIAGKWNKSPAQAVFDILLAEEAKALMIMHLMDEADVEHILRHPLCMIGSDGIFSSGKPHPRLYGSFPRVYRRYVRERRVLTLEQAVHKMTGLPHEFHCLQGGHVAVGAPADLVLFHPEQIEDTATFMEPRQYPLGIEYVCVGGRVVYAKGAVIGGPTAGVVLRGQIWP